MQAQSPRSVPCPRRMYLAATTEIPAAAAPIRRMEILVKPSHRRRVGRSRSPTASVSILTREARVPAASATPKSTPSGKSIRPTKPTLQEADTGTSMSGIHRDCYLDTRLIIIGIAEGCRGAQVGPNPQIALNDWRY